MTAVLVVSHALVLLLGLGVGARIRYCRSETEWVLRGQRQAELTHAGWHPVVADGWNGSDVPRPRPRADDQQFMVRDGRRSLPRPVLYDV